jgi:hypothetical protein
MSLHDNIDARNGTAVLDAPRTNGKQNSNATHAFHTRANVGNAAPAFRMKTTRDIQRLESRVALGDYRGRWLVLFFNSIDINSRVAVTRRDLGQQGLMNDDSIVVAFITTPNAASSEGLFSDKPGI